MDLSALLLILTVGLLTPGPDFVLVLRGGLAGMRRGQMTVLGIVTGLAIQMLVLLLGFGAIGSRPEVLQALRYVGAAVLGWLGLKLLLRRRNAPTKAPEERRLDGRAAFLEGLLCNMTNPKAFLFFAALFSRTQQANAAPEERIWLAVAIVLHGLACWTVVNALLQVPRLRAMLLRLQEPMLNFFGALLVLFAGLTALG